MDYQDYKSIKQSIEANFEIYWIRIFNLVEDYETKNGIRIKKDNKKELQNLKKTVTKWEKSIREYCEEVRDKFSLDLFDADNEDKYEFEEFKDNIFTELWTVNSPLKMSVYDKEVNYRDSFIKTSAAEIFAIVKNILSRSYSYVKYEAGNIDYNQIKSVDQLKLDFLDSDDMLLSGVIDLGIRSEILHRIYPGKFPMMTRRSLWAFFYLTSEAAEFITEEVSRDGKRAGKSHNWEYEYQRFTYYSNILVNLLENKLYKFGINMQHNLRFGYIKEFLNEIWYLHS